MSFPQEEQCLTSAVLSLLRSHVALRCSPLPSYSRDAASRRALQAAIQQLAEAQPEATAKNLLHSLQSSGVGSKACAPR